MITDSQIVRLCKRNNKMKAERGTWSEHWQDVSRHVMPRAADFTVQRSAGDKRNNHLYDNTGIHANRTLAAGLHGMLTNPSAKWFGLRLAGSAEQPADVKDWLEKSENAVFDAINAPDVAFASNIHEFYQSLTSVGTAAMFIGESSTRENSLVFRPIHISELCVAENADGIVDTVFREFKMSLRQLVQQFGEDALSPKCKESYTKQEYDKEITILHCVYPREDYNPDSKRPDELPIASVYLIEKEKHVLSESGFHEMPYMVTRWSKAIGEVFGRSPAMDALPDVKMLQEMMKTTIKAAQKIVDPPLLMPDDGVIGPVRAVAGGLTYYRGNRGDNIRPLYTGGQIGLSEELLEQVRDRIRFTFYLDQLEFSRGPAMTATEVIERTERTMRLLGPTLGRLQSEFLGPMLDRIFGIMTRGEMLPPPPDMIQGAPMNIEYVSPLARAQRQAEMQGISRTYEMVGFMAGIDPMAARIIKAGDTVRHVAEINGVPPKLMKSEEELQAEVQAEQQQMAAQQQLMALQQGADIAKTASEVQGGV